MAELRPLVLSVYKRLQRLAPQLARSLATSEVSDPIRLLDADLLPRLQQHGIRGTLLPSADILLDPFETRRFIRGVFETPCDDLAKSVSLAFRALRDVSCWLSFPFQRSASAVTDGIRVEVTSRFGGVLPDGRFGFVYRVRIANEGKGQVQLLGRHWDVEDASGEKETVDGPGVIGSKPLLSAGQDFEYESFMPLSALVGKASGYYTMLDTASGRTFRVQIPSFGMYLDV